MNFTKMNGLGNDYIFIDGDKNQCNFSRERIRRLCDRNYGIGGDGIIVVNKCHCADFSMKIFNSDGSDAEMCGNALRCLVKYVIFNHLTDKMNLTVSTKAGIRRASFRCDGQIDANMGNAKIFPSTTINGVEGYIVDVGNPHFVIPVREKLDATFEKYAKSLSDNTTFFPNKTNVEVVAFDKISNKATMRVWERGAGETLACGTGASAVFAVGCMLGQLKENAELTLRGGKLLFRHDEKGEIIATGDAEINYIGTTYE